MDKFVLNLIHRPEMATVREGVMKRRGYRR